ncbi:hypothetical protein LEN26_001841 [Aphanomyces euteiches]|nr:hypothetical protein AeMF1_005803 [Aphanomyces euteiches]KAH9160449.1 hypothetical protein LEN26_001841 [Aphanomyces euteiches]KAH9181046.1 hypothetical protein AeNC1_016979 [Aphanomyces euteiches]
MSMILRDVEKRHASVNTVMHALYGYYFLGVSKQQLATLYRKHVSTIDNWIQRYEADGTYRRRQTTRQRKFTEVQKLWVIDYCKKHPLSFLDEAKAAFQQKYGITISVPTIWEILCANGYTRKVLERRAINIKVSDIIRFSREMQVVAWSQLNIQFLDEASFDNRGMLRTRGYCLKGKKLTFRGEFTRKPRVSVLCWINIDGVAEVFHTEGTFNRMKFIECCRIHAHSRKSVHAYPGRGSIWILDGAKIHCHASIVHYLRSISIVPLFLPAYCPFLNPIEYLFGLVKKKMQRHYVENTREPLDVFVLRMPFEFDGFNMTRIFEHCGYNRDGVFDPSRAMSSNTVAIGPGDELDVQDLLEFTERDGEDEEEE